MLFTLSLQPFHTKKTIAATNTPSKNHSQPGSPLRDFSFLGGWGGGGVVVPCDADVDICGGGGAMGALCGGGVWLATVGCAGGCGGGVEVLLAAIGGTSTIGAGSSVMGLEILLSSLKFSRKLFSLLKPHATSTIFSPSTTTHSNPGTSTDISKSSPSSLRCGSASALSSFAKVLILLSMVCNLPLKYS